MKGKRAQRGPYRRLLIPTDGSPLAAKGVRAGVALARTLGARVTGLYVARKESMLEYGSGALYEGRLLLEDHRKRLAAEAKAVLGTVKAAADALGVRCSVETAAGNQPWRSMLRVARRRRCDLIVLASRGRGGLGGLVLGSQTGHLLGRSKIAVLVVR